jgi:acetyltransferase-like isoleucine patch superfamily enzyme
LGALSLANKNLSDYTLFAGIPAKKIKLRNKVEIENLEKKYKNE